MEKETVRVELDLPRDLLGALDVAEKDLGPQLKKRIALELFHEQHISSGKAAELLGMSKAEFVDLLDRHGIAYFTETPDEVTAQVDAVQETRDRREQ